MRIKIMAGRFKLVLQMKINLETESAEERRRKKCPCVFDPQNGIRMKEFQDIVYRVAEEYARLKVDDITGAVVTCSVSPLAGDDNWEFSLDFNNYGKVTGKCWFDADNLESSLPNEIACKISNGIQSLLFNEENFVEEG